MNNDFNKLFKNAGKQLGTKSSPFKKNNSASKSVWIDRSLYKKIQLLTFKHDHTTIKYWVNLAIRHAFHDGTLK